MYIYNNKVYSLFYSNEQRRTFKSIIQALSEIVQLFIFFFIITFSYACLGKLLLGDL